MKKIQTVDPEKRISILIVHEHTLVREGLKAAFGQEEGWEVVGEADNGDAAVVAAQRLAPDVVIIDVSRPEFLGFDAAEKISESMPETKVIVMDRFAREKSIMKAVSVGAAGYVLTESGPDDFFRAVREAKRGNAHFSPQVSAVMLRLMRDSMGPDRRSRRLP